MEKNKELRTNAQNLRKNMTKEEAHLWYQCLCRAKYRFRRQYVIEVYKAPKNHLNLNGWGTYQHMLKIAACVNGTTNKLV